MESETIELVKACREAKFPLCLERALVKMFKDKNLVFSLAARGGFKSRPVSRSLDVWELYLDFLSSLNKQLGKDAAAVIESQTLAEIEAMGCTQCPIYKLELTRKEKRYSDELPVATEFLCELS